jgi:hypothetical protein
LRRTGALILLSVALAGAGCASGNDDLQGELLAERQEHYNILTRAEVSAQPAGSPGRAILTLWRAVQFRNPEGALARVSPPPTGDQIDDFEGFIVGAGASAASTTKPEVLDVNRVGRRANVLLEFHRKRKVGDRIKTRMTGRLQVGLVRGPTGWLVLWRPAADKLPAAVS